MAHVVGVGKAAYDSSVQETASGDSVA